ncbi:MAG: hypothetical protein BWY85_00639 [Firmicutes bacterium ADurb.Bin506]|nr:MAG: hypothetical protein BWY85_00639 [Firmicutes bacterium ADurb.Bin506]
MPRGAYPPFAVLAALAVITRDADEASPAGAPLAGLGADGGFPVLVQPKG